MIGSVASKYVVPSGGDGKLNLVACFCDPFCRGEVDNAFMDLSESYMAGLSKSRIIVWKQCPKRLWLEINRPELANWGEAQNGRMATGNTVGEVARSLWPDGVLIEGDDLKAALAK